MSEPTKAAFLSYASQDADAARRIADALRAAGVEVWFDQSELVGGDSWDQKIRKQIKECALLIPIISAATQARTEGYFRLEWRLADQRTHLMAKGRPFLLPVVIDATRDADAQVPDSFTEVQWTRLRPLGFAGQAPQDEDPVLAKFVARVKKLLAGGQGTGDWGQETGDGVQGTKEMGQKTGWKESGRRARSKTEKRGFEKWWWLIFPIMGMSVPIIGVLKSKPASTERPRSPPPAAAAAAGIALTEAQKLVAQARSVYDNGDELNRDNLFLAEELVHRALALDPGEPSGWELGAWLSYIMLWHSIDDTQTRRETLVRQANRAIALAPDSVAARLVFATAQLIGPNISEIRFAEIESSLRQLAERDPQNWKIQRSLGIVHWLAGRIDDAVGTLSRAIELSNGHPMIAADLANVLIRNNRFAEAETVLARALAQHRSGRLLTFNLIVISRWRGDLDRAVKDIADWPGWLLQQDRGFSVAWQAALWAREPEMALRLVQQFPRQYVRDITFSGPRAALSARAQELAGNTVAAQADWRATLQQCDADLGANAADVSALFWRAWALARLGDQVGAQSAATLLRQRIQTVQNNYIGSYNAASLWATVGWTDEAIAALQSELQSPVGYITLTRAHLELEPAFDPIRNDPRFQELVRQAPAPISQPPARPEPAERVLSSPPPVDSKSIAVLPFANLSPDPENAFFCDGVHDDVITVLAKIRDLHVISRTSTLAYRDPAARNLRTIAAELGVAHVLEGSVRRAGNKVRVSAQLINARTDAHLWAETYDGDLTDIFALQAKLAQQIAAALQARLTGSELALIERRPTGNQEAYGLFLRARALQQEQGDFGTVADFERIISIYEHALTLDPKFVLAYVQLAQMHSMLYWYGFLDPSPARAAKIKLAVDAAVRLAPEAPETHVALGTYYYRIEHDWNRALAEFRQAEINLPNDALLQTLIGFTLRRLGRWSEAADRLQQAVALNPRDLSAVTNYTTYLPALRRWEAARKANDKALAYFPADTMLLQTKARIDFVLNGDLPAYARAMEELPPVVFDPAGASTKYEAALLRGDLAGAHRALDQLGDGQMWQWWGNVVSDPTSYFHTYLAFLEGDHEATRRWADQALAIYRAGPWNDRQAPWVGMRIAQLQAWTGEPDEALRVGRAVVARMANEDPAQAIQFKSWFGMILVSLRQNDEAIEMLRELLRGPSVLSPNEIRIDPLWSRLKDDPRFEEILGSAKPL